MSKKLRMALAAGVVLKGAVLVGAAAFSAYKRKKEYDLKFDRALDSDVKKEYLESKAHELNKIYEGIQKLFTPIGSDFLNDEMKENGKVKFDFESTGFTELDLVFDEMINKPIKKGYFKLITRTDKNLTTEFLLRVTVEDWDGYMDVVICEADGFYSLPTREDIKDYESAFKVVKKGNVFTLSPEVDEVFAINVDFIGNGTKEAVFLNIDGDKIFRMKELY